MKLAKGKSVAIMLGFILCISLGLSCVICISSRYHPRNSWYGSMVGIGKVIMTGVTILGGSTRHAYADYIGGVAVSLASGGSVTLYSDGVMIRGGSSDYGGGAKGYPVYAQNGNYTVETNEHSATIENGFGTEPWTSPYIGY